jgi:hypothetical protein
MNIWNTFLGRPRLLGVSFTVTSTSLTSLSFLVDMTFLLDGKFSSSSLSGQGEDGVARKEA